MKYTIVAVGKMRPPYVDDAEHYAKLLRGHARVEVVELKEDADVARRLPDRAHVVLLDVGGRELSSEELAEWLEERRQSGLDLCFVVGGPRGLSLERCDTRLSFGPITFLVCVLGGLGNMIGGFIAAFIFAQFISVGGFFLHLEWGYVLAFLFFIGFMFWRPRGLLGGKS